MQGNILFSIMTDNSGVYQIKNIMNNKIYIGSSFDVFERLLTHIRKLKNNKHTNKHLQNAWNKYGFNNFEFEILEKCETNKDILLQKEQIYLNLFKSWDRTIGYNRNKIANSSLGIKRSIETIEKMKKVGLGKEPWNKGQTTCNETRIKQSLKKNKFKKSIERIDPITGEIKEYQSLKDAQKDGFNRFHISQCCFGKIDKHKNYYWKFLDNNNV